MCGGYEADMRFESPNIKDTRLLGILNKEGLRLRKYNSEVQRGEPWKVQYHNMIFLVIFFISFFNAK